MSTVPRPLSRASLRRAIGAAGAAGMAFLVTLAAPLGAAAHGPVPAEPPTVATLALDWHVEPLVAAALVLAAVAWLALVQRVRRVHPETPVPAVRTVAFLGGLFAIAVALMSGIERYDTTLFSVHMVQHLLLLLVAPPLLALAAPVTQLLRASSPEVRNRVLLPILHSTAAAVLANPIVTWLTFGLVLWISHFSPLFNIALEDQGAHDLEHAAYLVAGLLFWWPVVGLDPAPRRMGFAARVLYLLLQLPINSFLGMAILFADDPLYPHYATLGSPYGISALADQQLAGGLMWLAGDIAFIGAILGVIAGWMRHDQRDAPAAERRADVQRARLRDRADLLARTRAAASGGEGGAGPSNQAGSGDVLGPMARGAAPRSSEVSGPD